MSQKKAFAVAQRLAAEAWLTRPALESSGNLYEQISQVEPALGHSAEINVQDEIAKHVSDRDLQIRLSDALGAEGADAREAGYLYGLALGLVLGRGGVR